MPTAFTQPVVTKIVVEFGQGDLDRAVQWLIDIRARNNATVAEAMFNDRLISATANSTVESITQDYHARKAPAPVT